MTKSPLVLRRLSVDLDQRRAGTIERRPDFILDYWDAPLHWSDGSGTQWFLDAPAVVNCYVICKAGCTATATRTPRCPTRRCQSVRQRRCDRGDLITSSRRRHRIERLAAHFEVARGQAGWRIISIQAAPTSSDSLNSVWPQAD
jgi:hypothetical protein